MTMVHVEYIIRIILFVQETRFSLRQKMKELIIVFSIISSFFYKK